VVGRVIHRTDGAAEADGAVRVALEPGKAVAAAEGAAAVGQIDAALDLEDGLGAGHQLLVVAKADARGVVDELVVRLVRRYGRIGAVSGSDALGGDVDPPVDLQPVRYLRHGRHRGSGRDGRHQDLAFHLLSFLDIPAAVSPWLQFTSTAGRISIRE